MLLLISDANILIDMEAQALSALGRMKASKRRLPWMEAERLLREL